METFKYHNLKPPGGVYFYKAPETGEYFESRNRLHELLDMVAHYYAINDMEVPGNLQALVEDFMCRNIAPGFCDGTPTEGAARFRPISFFDAHKFTEVVLRKAVAHLKGESPYVSQEEADRRAAICMQCPMHMMHVCTGCDGLRGVARKLVGNRKTKYDDFIRICGVCGCALNGKVHLKKRVLKETEEVLNQVPDTCWLKDKVDDGS